MRVQVAVGEPLLATAVPASAVRKCPAGDHVFVVVADEQGKTRARLREVVVDAMSGDDVVITKGLEPGEQVAASGSLMLYLICCLGLLRLRARNVEMEGKPFSAPGGPFVPLAAAGIIVWMLSTVTLRELFAALCIVAVSGAAYGIHEKLRRRPITT